MALRDTPTRIERRYQETAGTETSNEMEPLVTENTPQMEAIIVDQSTNAKKHFCKKFLFSLVYEFCWSGLIILALYLFQQNCKFGI